MVKTIAVADEFRISRVFDAPRERASEVARKLGAAEGWGTSLDRLAALVVRNP